MARFKTFPHANIHVIDESKKDVFLTEEIPLHVPLFLSFAEKGVPNKPYFGTYDEITPYVGKGTFDELSPFFTHQTLFARTAAQNQPIFFVRLAPEDAATASLVLEAEVVNEKIPQWERDSEGRYVLDQNDNKVPLLDSSTGEQILEDGLKITWKVRALDPSEDPSGLLIRTVNFDGTEIKIYPVLVLTPRDGAGAFGNNLGISLWWNYDGDAEVIAENESLVYRMAIYDKPWGIDSPVVVRDFFTATYNDFMFKPDAIDTSVMMRLDFESIMENNYKDNNPFEYVVYTDYIKELGQRIVDIESATTPELTSPWMANIFEAQTSNRVPYYKVIIDEESTNAVLMQEGVIHNLMGGSDGTLTNENFESLAKSWLNGLLFDEIKDHAKYPITHLYDSGFSLETKVALIDFLGIRDDVQIILSTQDVSRRPNTKAEDQSAGSYLRSMVLLHPESKVDGTQACRATIFQQCGYINFSTTYKKLVPLTLDALYKRCIMHNSTFIKGEWKGLPNSSVDLFRWISWTAYDEDVKQLSWNTGLNYVQHYDMTRVHYPDILSVYPFQTSLLSSDTFTCYIVYLKHLIRRVWAEFVGVEEPVEKIGGRIKAKLDKLVSRVFKNYWTVDFSIYETDEDKLLGYRFTVEAAVYDSVAKRVWDVPIKVRRIEDRTSK